MTKNASMQPCVGKPKVRKPRTPKEERPEVPKARRDDEGPENEKKRQSPESFYKEVSEVTGAEMKVVKAIFDALPKLAVTKMRKHGQFAIPQIVLFRLKDTKARPVTTKKLFDKEVTLAAKPPGKRVHPLILKPLKIAANVASE